MRRFLIWSILTALVGLLLMVGGYWAYWNFYARYQPVTITRHQAEIQRLLDEAPYVSEGSGGTPIWIVGYRDSGATQRYVGPEAERLRAGGVEPRIVLFARPDREGQAMSTAAERATVAELWLSRDWRLYQRWMATPSAQWTAAGLPVADGNLARSGVVDAGRAFAERLSGLLRDNDVATRWPLVVWRDPQGFLKACACSESRAWPFIRDDLGIADRRRAADAGAPVPVEAGPPATTDPARPPVAADGGPGDMPYPNLPEIQATPGPVLPSAPIPGRPLPAPSQSAPSQPAPTTAPPAKGATPAARPGQSRPAPKAEPQEDSTFF